MSDHPSMHPEDAARDVEEFRYVVEQIRQQVSQVIVGQDDIVDQLLITLLVGGHCLITGMPGTCLLYTSPSPRDATLSRMPSSA